MIRFEKGLQSTHELKKITYRMLRKLHTLEYKSSLNDCQKIGSKYAVILYLEHMLTVMKRSYEGLEIINPLIAKIDNLIRSIQNQNHVNRVLLVSCLKKHTYVFNMLESNHVYNIKNAELSELWSMKCLSTYVFQFGNNL